jgi:hypothetical protein
VAIKRYARRHVSVRNALCVELCLNCLSIADLVGVAPRSHTQ